MNRPIRSICLMLAAGLSLSLAQTAPGSAQNANAAIDCSKADSTMMQQPGTSQAMQPTGDVDKDYAQMMMMHNDQMMAMSKTEAACGKNPKTKAYAQNQIKFYSAGSKQLKAFVGGGQ